VIVKGTCQWFAVNGFRERIERIKWSPINPHQPAQAGFVAPAEAFMPAGAVHGLRRARRWAKALGYHYEGHLRGLMAMRQSASSVLQIR